MIVSVSILVVGGVAAVMVWTAWWLVADVFGE
jgi:hypothetical protein